MSSRSLQIWANWHSNESYALLDSFRDEQRRFLNEDSVELYLDKSNCCADQSIKLDKMGLSLYCHPSKGNYSFVRVLRA